MLVFISLGLLVFFADHLVHSIQVDAIMNVVQRNTVLVIQDGLLLGGEDAPEVPAGATAITSRRSGYVQAVHCRTLLTHAARHGLACGCGPGSASTWSPGPRLRGFARFPRRSGTGPAALHEGPGCRSPGRVRADPGARRRVRYRQLVDTTCEALSPAVNDPYTAVQAIDHLSVIFCALAQRPLGNHIARHPGGAAVIVPGRRFPEYLAVMCGLIRRYGASEPTVADALLRLLGACADIAGNDPELCAAIQDQAHIIIADAEREIPQPADLISAHAEAETLRQAVLRHRSTAG